MNDAVLFRSDRFSLEPTPEGDRVYDLPLGDDLAAVLRARLLDLAPGLWIDEPIREDWGTVLWVRDGSEEYYINIHWVPGDDFDNRWGITFRKIRGLMGVLLRRPGGPGECRALQQLVAHVLAGDAETSNIRSGSRRTSTRLASEPAVGARALSHGPSNKRVQLTRSHGTFRTWSRFAAPRATACGGPRS